MWLKEDDCEEVVVNRWNSMGNGVALQHKIDSCSPKLMACAKNRFQDKAYNIKRDRIQHNILMRDSVWAHSIQ